MQEKENVKLLIEEVRPLLNSVKNYLDVKARLFRFQVRSVQVFLPLFFLFFLMVIGVIGFAIYRDSHRTAAKLKRDREFEKRIDVMKRKMKLDGLASALEQE